MTNTNHNTSKSESTPGQCTKTNDRWNFGPENFGPGSHRFGPWAARGRGFGPGSGAPFGPGSHGFGPRAGGPFGGTRPKKSELEVMKAARDLTTTIISSRDTATKQQRIELKALLQSTTEQAKRILSA